MSATDLRLLLLAALVFKRVKEPRTLKSPELVRGAGDIGCSPDCNGADPMLTKCPSRLECAVVDGEMDLFSDTRPLIPLSPAAWRDCCVVAVDTPELGTL